jgi:hypothetical protein
MGKGKLTAHAAVLKVLGGAPKPLRVPEISDLAVPLTSLSGKTPRQTIYSVLYAELKKDKPLWERVDKGTFKLSRTGKAAAKAEPVEAVADAVEDQKEVAVPA